MKWLQTVAVTVALAIMPGVVSAATTQPADPDRESFRQKAAPAIARALQYQAEAQAADGGWPGPFGGSDPAITALVAKTFIQAPAYGPRHPIVQRAMRFVLKFQQSDGGIYDPKTGFRNYGTSVGLMMLASAVDPALQPKVRAAQQFLKDNQWIEGKCDTDGRAITVDHPW